MQGPEFNKDSLSDGDDDQTPLDLEPDVITMVVEAAHAVDFVGIVPPTQDFAVFDKIFEGPEGYNETLRRSGHHTSTLILERALITTFLKHKIAHERRFRLNLGRFLAGHRIADILFNFPGSGLLEGDEGLKTVVFHTYLGLMLSLRTQSTEAALMKIYVSLIEAAIAAPEPSSEGIEEEENSAWDAVGPSSKHAHSN